MGEHLITIIDVARQAGVTSPAVHDYAKNHNMPIKYLGSARNRRAALTVSDAERYLKQRRERMAQRNPEPVPEPVLEPVPELAPEPRWAPQPPVIVTPKTAPAPEASMVERLAAIEREIRRRIATIEEQIDTLQVERDVLLLEAKDAAEVASALSRAATLIDTYEGREA